MSQRSNLIPELVCFRVFKQALHNVCGYFGLGPLFCGFHGNRYSVAVFGANGIEQVFFYFEPVAPVAVWFQRSLKRNIVNRPGNHDLAA